MDEKALICEYDKCKLILEVPITLPCGNTLCEQHVKQFDENFKCFFCAEYHEMPKIGFSPNRTINKMIDGFYQSNELRKKIKETFDKLNLLIKEYDLIETDVYVYDYFSEIRNQVDLHREQLIEQIHIKSDEIIRNLKEKEDKCRLNLQNIKKMNSFELNMNVLSLKQNYRMLNLNKKQLNDLLMKMNQNTRDIQLKTFKLKNDLLMNESFRFKKYETNEIFGTLSIELNNYNIISQDYGKLLNTYDEHSSLVTSIQVDEQTNKMISASCDKTIKIWNIKTSECIKTLNDHKDWVTSVLIISPMQLLISGSKDETIKIWDLNTNECMKTFKNKECVYSLCLISRNELACGTQNGCINIWNLNKSIKVKSVKAHNDWIPCLKMIGQSKLVSCSGDHKIKIWNIPTFECIKQLEGHSNQVFCLELIQMNDGVNLLSCSADKTVKLWDSKTGEMLKSFQFDYSIRSIQTVVDDLIAVALSNGQIELYSINKMITLNTISAHGSKIFRLNLMSNGSLLSASGHGKIKCWKIFD